jgi:hypothetical protein
VTVPSFHSDLSPSGADIFLNCIGAPNAQRGLPDDAGIEAAQGTIFHEYAEMCLQFGLEPHHFPTGVVHQIEGYEITYDQEMVDSMYAGLDYIREIVAQYPDALVFVEQWVEIPALGKDAQGRQRGGTSDVCIIVPSLRKIICFDWKYGGIPVYPTENNQARLYVLGCWNAFAGEIFAWDPHGIEVLIHIEQPRAPGGGGEWTTTMADVLAFGDDVAIKVKATEDPHAPRTPGHKQCRYCRARKTCGAKAAWEFDMFNLKFSDADVAVETFNETGILVPPVLPLPEDLTPERRSFILLNWASFKSWYDALREAALDDLRKGREVPLMKAVLGRSGGRKWNQDALDEIKRKAEALVGKANAYTKPELLSPAALEAAKGVGRAKFRETFAGLTVQEPPGLSLVPVTDKRDAVASVADAFSDDDV